MKIIDDDKFTDNSSAFSNGSDSGESRKDEDEGQSSEVEDDGLLRGDLHQLLEVLHKVTLKHLILDNVLVRDAWLHCCSLFISLLLVTCVKAVCIAVVCCSRIIHLCALIFSISQCTCYFAY